ncbi:MAG: hypothetical protein UT69_C0031G0001, partial [Candidatus Yanofskybacteria bacterium GW2011_GWE1_40_10]
TCIKNNIDVGASTNALTINGSLISLKEGSIEELDDMLMEHTTLEVIKDEEK